MLTAVWKCDPKACPGGLPTLALPRTPMQNRSYCNIIVVALHCYSLQLYLTYSGQLKNLLSLFFFSLDMSCHGKVTQKSMGKCHKIMGKWHQIMGKWYQIMGKWLIIYGEMTQNYGQMRQNTMGNCLNGKVSTPPWRLNWEGTGNSKYCFPNWFCK